MQTTPDAKRSSDSISASAYELVTIEEQVDEEQQQQHTQQAQYAEGGDTQPTVLASEDSKDLFSFNPDTIYRKFGRDNELGKELFKLYNKGYACCVD